MDSYYKETEEWRRSADENLRKENGWLALAGLFWLDEGENSIGTGPSNDILLPSDSAPDRIGVFNLRKGQVSLQVLEGVNVKIDGEEGKEAILIPDVSGSPTLISLGQLTFMLIEREDGLGIRYWDNQRQERIDFPGRKWYSIQKEFLVKGSYQPFDKDLDLVMSRKNGSDFQDQAQGQVIFQLDGRDLSLVVFEQKDGSLFTMFLDQTSGKDSYGSGRYLVIDPPKEKMVEIDFNRAYNPPCAFTNFATCPLPPSQNKLDLEIRVGEKL